MKKRLFITLLAAFLAAAATGPSGVRQATANNPVPGDLLALTNQAMLDATPAPADDPLLDANGAVVLDATGKPVSDPAEGFHKVIPSVYDPAHTHLVQSTWLDGTGCPTGAAVATYPSTTQTGTYTDPACDPALSRPGDPKDKHNEGLLLMKTGPTSNNAAAQAELKKVRGITLTELGYDIRKFGTGTHTGAPGSQCDVDSPRFNILTTTGFFFLACDSPPPTTEAAGAGWIRLRWGTGVAGSVSGFSSACPISFVSCAITGTVQRIQVLLDEGTDTGPTFFGGAFLDNFDVNGTIVGRGPTGPGMAEDQSKDDDDDD